MLILTVVCSLYNVVLQPKIQLGLHIFTKTKIINNAEQLSDTQRGEGSQLKHQQDVLITTNKKSSSNFEHIQGESRDPHLSSGEKTILIIKASRMTNQRLSCVKITRAFRKYIFLI